MVHNFVHGRPGGALLAPAGRLAGDGRVLPRGRFLLTRFLRRPPTDGPAADPAPLPLRPASAPRVHPTAVVDPKAVIGDDCEVGPFCLVGPQVVMGPGNRLEAHVVITGHTTVGADNHFFPNAVIGSVPQDKKYRGEDTQLIIGDRNSVREAVTMHTGTLDGGGFTRLGSDNLLMVNCHVGHDCTIGNHCILGNNVMLAGHTTIEDRVNMAGASGSNHFVTIGRYAYIAAMGRLHFDVPPFMKVTGDDEVWDVNTVGLTRGGVDAEAIAAIEAAARQLFFTKKNKRPFATVLAAFEADPDTHPRVRELAAFLRRRDSGKGGRYLESLRAKKG